MMAENTESTVPVTDGAAPDAAEGQRRGRGGRGGRCGCGGRCGRGGPFVRFGCGNSALTPLWGDMVYFVSLNA